MGAGGLWGAVGDIVASLPAQMQFIGEVVTHAVVGGALSMAQGGSFVSGALSGAVGAVGSAVGMSLGANDIVSSTAISAVAGGTASVLAGGKFANGAITAAFANMYNKFRHQGTDHVNPWDVGNDAHQTFSRYAEQDPNVWTDSFSDGAGTLFAGRPDVGNRATRELWEIKPEGGLIQGGIDLMYYLGANTGPAPHYQAGGYSAFRSNVQPLGLIGSYGFYDYRLAAPGVILYSFTPGGGVESTGFAAYWMKQTLYGKGPTVLPLGGRGGRLQPR